MMSSVRERTREIGIFRAIGFRRSHVMHIILIEAGFLSAIAGVFGYLAGLGIAKLILPFFTESQGVKMPFDPVLAGAALVLAVIVGLLASAYPAVMAARLDPNEALRAL
jgi:putative ABC transport system permease protein